MLTHSPQSLPRSVIQARRRSCGEHSMESMEEDPLRDAEPHPDVLAAATTERRPPQRERDHVLAFARIAAPVRHGIQYQPPPVRAPAQRSSERTNTPARHNVMH